MRTNRIFSIHCNNRKWLQSVLISREVHVFETNCVKGLHDFSLGCVHEPQKEFKQTKRERINNTCTYLRASMCLNTCVYTFYIIFDLIILNSNRFAPGVNFCAIHMTKLHMCKFTRCANILLHDLRTWCKFAHCANLHTCVFAFTWRDLHTVQIYTCANNIHSV